MVDELNLLDRKILYYLDINSRTTFKELGRKIRTAKETVAFRVKKLVKNGYIIKFLTTIHTSNVNRFYYKLFYKFHKTTLQLDSEIINFIKDFQSIAYFASLEGRYDITFLILAKDFRDLYTFLVPFRERFGKYILEQEILTMLAVHRFNFRFFYEQGELVHTKYPVELSEPKIDQTDYLIIKSLAQNSRISLIELAKITNTETNVVKYRIQKLKKKNIFGSNVLHVNFEKFNIQHIQVDFTLKDHSITNKIIEYISQNPKSTFATVTLGKYDIALEFAVKDMKELHTILNNIKDKFSQEITNHDVFILQEHNINWFPY